MVDVLEKFQELNARLIGLPVSHVWRGYGSALFLEFGLLSNSFLRSGRALRNPSGEFGLCIEWSWRIEGKRRIWCGSWSDEDLWPRNFARLTGATIASLSLIGRLSEIDLSLSNGLHVVSMMTAEGDPSWTLSEHQVPGQSFSIRCGSLRMDPWSI